MPAEARRQLPGIYQRGETNTPEFYIIYIYMVAREICSGQNFHFFVAIFGQYISLANLLRLYVTESVMFSE